jgi:hypothetical protein
MRFRIDQPLYYYSSVITAFFYQTNPAWYHGTSGYGPSRHAIFYYLTYLFYLLLSFQ